MALVWYGRGKRPGRSIDNCYVESGDGTLYAKKRHVRRSKMQVCSFYSFIQLASARVHQLRTNHAVFRSWKPFPLVSEKQAQRDDRWKGEQGKARFGEIKACNICVIIIFLRGSLESSRE